MAKNRYKPKPLRSAKTFRRSGHHGAARGSSILIVTEGVVTEPVYFRRVRNLFSSSTVELVIYGTGRGDPRKLVDYAIETRNDRIRMARNNRLRLDQVTDFDEIWIVFDTDVLESDKLNNGIQYARSKDINVAHSTPCFEYWFLLHAPDGYTTAPMSRCSNVTAYLQQSFGWPSYAKDEATAEQLILPIISRESLVTAIDAAQRVRDAHKREDSSLPANPSTDVDQLIRAIDGAVGPADKLRRDQ